MFNYFEHVCGDVFDFFGFFFIFFIFLFFEHVGTDVFEIMKITVSKAFGGVRVGVSHNY
jgi:hypothetical protein